MVLPYVNLDQLHYFFLNQLMTVVQKHDSFGPLIGLDLQFDLQLQLIFLGHNSPDVLLLPSLLLVLLLISLLFRILQYYSY